MTGLPSWELPEAPPTGTSVTRLTSEALMRGQSPQLREKPGDQRVTEKLDLCVHRARGTEKSSARPDASLLTADRGQCPLPLLRLWAHLIVSLPQSRIPWEELLSEGPSRSALRSGIVSVMVDDEEDQVPQWAAPSPGSGPCMVHMGRDSKWWEPCACLCLFLSALDRGHD